MCTGQWIHNHLMNLNRNDTSRCQHIADWCIMHQFTYLQNQRMRMLNLQRGMTLIEVLVTIVVFSAGILVILAVITNGLTLGNRSRNRTTATMLAKE